MTKENKDGIGFLVAGILLLSSYLLIYFCIYQMKKISELDILIGCLQIISNYFIIQEFSNSKISLYEKTIYNNLKKIIKEKKKK